MDQDLLARLTDAGGELYVRPTVRVESKRSSPLNSGLTQESPPLQEIVREIQQLRAQIYNLSIQVSEIKSTLAQNRTSQQTNTFPSMEDLDGFQEEEEVPI